MRAANYDAWVKRQAAAILTAGAKARGREAKLPPSLTRAAGDVLADG